MLAYKEFKEEMMAQLESYLPGGREAYKIEEIQVKKVNIVEDQLHIFRLNPPCKVSPSVRFQELYNQFQEKQNLETVLIDVAMRIDDLFKTAPSEDVLDYDELKKKVIFEIVNTEMNRELLREIPHREYMDLSIVYRWILEKAEEGTYTTLLRNEHLECLNLTEEQLYQLAYENTSRMYPTKVVDMNDFIERTMSGLGPFEKSFLNSETEINTMGTMVVITNSAKEYGASAMLYEDILHKIAEKIGTDLYLLPSSRHEMLAVSVEIDSAYELAQMVKEINEKEVKLEDFLSDNVYHYDKKLREVTLADTSLTRSRTENIVQPVPSRPAPALV